MNDNGIVDNYPSLVVNHTIEKNIFHFYSVNQVVLKIEVISDSIIRVRYGTEGTLEEDFSYAIDKTYVGSYSHLELHETEKTFMIETKTVKCYINKSNLKLTFKDIDENVINEDEKGYHWEEFHASGGNIVKQSKHVFEKEMYFGLGDKPHSLNVRGKRLQIWGTDEYGFHKDTDPIYKNIPFYMGLHHGIGYGIFFDNTFRSFFDFASERNSACSFWAEGGEMNYYFIAGPDLVDVVKRYTMLTGTPDLPPLWSLGYHQCKWSYYPEANVREVTDKFRELRLPADAIYFDIDYMDGFRCFTWDKERFPDPKKLVSDLKENGFKSIVIIDPGIKIDPEYSIFKEGLEKGYFCKRGDGPLMKGKVWPGDCYFPDFTNPEVREWWSGLFDELIDEIGIAGVWNDMNEPAVFETPNKSFPDDVRHNYDGHECSHRKAHNVYGMQMARATFHGVRKSIHPERPFVITRSAYSGAQRYCLGWTGDNISSWEHLLVANRQVQRMAVSGFSFIGSDIGGFIDHPSPELYTRWMQLGTFHPFFRTHSSGDHGDQEPWSFGEKTIDVVRKTLELRYQLLPYIYTAFYQYVSQYMPMTRPLAYVYQNDDIAIQKEEEFLLGDNILICPVSEPNPKSKFMYLPEGEWFNYFSGEKSIGGKDIEVPVTIETIPVFVKAGSVIPHFPVQQYVGEKEIKEITLKVYVGGTENDSSLYEDRGNGKEHRSGKFNYRNFKSVMNGSQFKLTQHVQRGFNQSYDTFKVELIGMEGTKYKAFVDGTAVKLNDHSLIVQEGFGDIEVKW